MKTVYIDGDSTTFGMFDREMGGWPNRLHVATLHQETDLEDATFVYNRAMPGRTLAGILREADANMRYFRRLGAVSAVVQTGMNEVKTFPPSSTPVTPPRLFGRQLIQFCDVARENSCSPVLVGPPPIDTTRYNPTFSGAVINDELLVEYGEIMRDTARRVGCPYVDTRAVFANTGRPITALIDSEGYHPNSLGDAALAAAVSDALQLG